MRFGNPIAEEASDGDLLALVAKELKETHGITSAAHFSRIYRLPRSMPQYTLGHVERVAEIESRIAAIDGLEVAGAAYHGVGIPDCIASGEGAAERIGNYLRNAVT